METEDAFLVSLLSKLNSLVFEKNRKFFTARSFVFRFSCDGTASYSHDLMQKKIAMVRRSARAIPNSVFA